ncbi:MAG: glycosyltransferase family 4 protein, partial [Bacteroidales bacterium]|nr:glycosyltransferase family 4 protein [Bacteroidales bacterium]
MRIAMLSPIAWRTPPVHYGPWELVTSLLTEELVKMGVDVTLFATGKSITNAKLMSVCENGYEEDKSLNPKVYECLHISNCFERANEFDLIHNQFDFLPLTYSKLVNTPVVTTIHGFSSPSILPVFEKYNGHVHYVSISNADRAPSLDYIATVYHGIDLDQFHFNNNPKRDYLLFYGRIHNDKGAYEAIQISKKVGLPLIMAGIIQDVDYFNERVKPFLKPGEVDYIGSVGGDRREELLGNALALLHPINFNEPFGLSVIESMACGTPVIAFSRGSMPELITDGCNGFLVNDIPEAVSKVKLVERINRNDCRVTVEKRFTKEVM